MPLRDMMNSKLISIIFAIALTVVIGLILPAAINLPNYSQGNITIADQPVLEKALQNAQSDGVLMGLEEWKYDNISNISPYEARITINNGISIFNQSRLTPAILITPYTSLRSLTPSIREAIWSTGIPTLLPSLQTNDSPMVEYGSSWGDMTSFSDPRYAYESQKIAQDQPTSILLNVNDWNSYLKSLIINYLSSTEQKNITIRVDDIEPYTPSEKINDMTSLLQYTSVGQVVFSIIPQVPKNDPTILGISTNDILRGYWWYFIFTAFLPLSFFITWRFISNNRIRRYRYPTFTDTQRLPFVSLVIPAYNEEKEIANCLEAVMKQDYTGRMETFFVNDGSTDKTADIISNYPVNLINLRQNVGKAKALNIGIKCAKGDILIFSDSDSHMASDAISSLVKRFEECPDAHIVAGNVFIDDCGKKGKLLRYFQMIEYRIEQEINRFLQSLKGQILVCPGPLFAVKRSVIDMVQFSDRTVVEDSDFTIQALKSSARIVWAPNANVFTCPPTTLLKWYKQRKRWWYGNLQIWRLNKKWALTNPWLVFNYLGYVFSLSSIALMLMLPLLLATYGNIVLIFIQGFPYLFIPVVLLGVCMAPFFIKERNLLLALLPYILIYTTLKVLVIGYIYIHYLIRAKMKIKFGAHTVDAS
jgi:cellulose synthase/poly-beta-1,6-N-acetylglucosamine synthase-like glycosyltransferase